MEFKLELKNKIIDDETLRWVEIYKITNKINQKVYIGQAISHRKSYNKYYPKGRAFEFLKLLKEKSNIYGNVAKLTGKSLEPSLPLACGNACEEHD
jgi:hypothetical protein